MWRDFEATITTQTEDYLVFVIDGVIPSDVANYTTKQFAGVAGGQFKLAHSQRRASGVSVGGELVSPHSVSPLPLEGTPDEVKTIRGRVCNKILLTAIGDEVYSSIQVQIYGLTYADGSEGKTSLYPVELERA